MHRLAKELASDQKIEAKKIAPDTQRAVSNSDFLKLLRPILVQSYKIYSLGDAKSSFSEMYLKYFFDSPLMVKVRFSYPL